MLLIAERIPNQDAIASSPTVGWMMLGFAVCVAVIFILNREGWRRLWLRAEDPRAMAVFRIVFGLCAMANVNGMWEMFEYLFTDQGIFDTAVARHVFARKQFEGFGNGLGDDPWGFFDWPAVFQWLKGPKYSLLLIWSSPEFFWGHLWAFEIAMICLIFGIGTKYTKWIAWFLFHGIITRNNVFWEGTENVYRTFFFYLCLSRCGHAYSVDNWLRCRKLRKKRLLSTRDGPGRGAGAPPSDEHPKGLAAIYRLIPGWPRLLVILQLAAMYSYTGIVKNGRVWMKGDAFYYALNLDHFYRFPPQGMSAIFGTNLFRIQTHVTHFWEMLFPLVVFGLIVRWGLREKLTPLPKAQRWLLRAAWVGLGLIVLAIVEYVYPEHYTQPKGSWWTLQRVQIAFGVGWIVGLGLIGFVYYRLRYRPVTATLRLPIVGRFEVTWDLDWFCRWFFGRRVWLTLGIIFHTHLIIMMNIGWFSPGALSAYFVCVNGGELVLIGSLIGRKMAALGIPFVPAHVRRGEPPLPAEDPTLPHLHRDDRRLPAWTIWTAAALAVIGVVAQYREILHFGWTLLGIGSFLLGATLREMAGKRGKLEVDPSPRGPDDPPRTAEQLSRPWAYGPFGRFVANALVIYQITGVAGWLLPDKDSFSKFRIKVHEPFKWWLRTTQTSQGWKMFAPNPPRSNLYMRVLVTDHGGEVLDLNVDMYHPANRPVPWIFYTRQRKVNRRISGAEGGKGSWYQKWHARYICRKWAADHDGKLPQKVQIAKITYPIPSPEYVRKHGPYDPQVQFEKKRTEKFLYTARCSTEVEAQLLPDQIERYDLPEPDKEARRWHVLRGKKKRWDDRHERERRKRERQAEHKAQKAKAAAEAASKAGK